MSKRTKRERVTRLVPRLVLGAVVASVIPACGNGCPPYGCLSVAQQAFDVPDVSSSDAVDSTPDVSGSDVRDVFDGSVADAAFSDVATDGFGPG